ncbi:related to copper amine oxidase [Phialocephala subalpina]|uniref:Amine oxidase n=1 Tax=Phialocephala subalpina TaxID=576137 RepID=A0A1L7XHX6_9HELO|nr:related to copper amine oxidase [Phialocephala subalpina]
MSSSSRPWVKITGFIAFILVVIAASSPFIKHVKTSFIPSHTSDANAYKAPKNNVWSDLSKWEANSVANFLLSSSGLNLTDSAKATSDDNAIKLIELLQPNKSDVLSYLDGSSGPPARWARVVVEQGATKEAHVTNYMVGPLPLDESSVVMPLEFCYSSGRNYALNPMADQAKLLSFAKSFAVGIMDILAEILSDDQHPFDMKGLGVHPRVNYIVDETLMIWMQLYRTGFNSDATSLLPQGIYIQLNASTRNPENWKVLQWYFNNKIYANETEFRVAMESPDFKKSGLNMDGHWNDIEDFDSAPPGREMPSPTMVQPNGARYRIDKEQNFVSWMGFDFYMSTSSDTGLFLHDIRFNGDSVMYEVGMQEALAHYAGDDPMQGGQEFLDSFLYMGLYMYELVPGYDCPAYATFLDTEFHFKDFPKTNKNSICIFEYTADYPLQRHTADKRVSISRNTYLVVRFVSTVWNYDYTFDYIFYLDGTIEVKVRASGFIFGAFWTGGQANEDEYGFRVHDAVSTSMHDHVINFKADLDIVGTENTMVRVGVEPLTAEYPWDDENTSPRNTMHLTKTIVEKEMGIDWPRNSGELFIVMNQNETNKWGQKRGYRVMPGTGVGTPVHLTILNSTTLGKAAEWAANDLWALKRKDTEPRSSSPLNALTPLDPIVDFGKYVDDEDIMQEDLVIWFNLGTHHIPHAGDIPNTLMHTSSSSVMFTPFNFHDRDPSIHTRQGVKMETGKKVRHFGGSYDAGVRLRKEDLEPDLSRYQVPVDAGTNHSFVDKLGGPAPWN